MSFCTAQGALRGNWAKNYKKIPVTNLAEFAVNVERLRIQTKLKSASTETDQDLMSFIINNSHGEAFFDVSPCLKTNLNIVEDKPRNIAKMVAQICFLDKPEALETTGVSDAEYDVFFTEYNQHFSAMLTRRAICNTYDYQHEYPYGQIDLNKHLETHQFRNTTNRVHELPIAVLRIDNRRWNMRASAVQLRKWKSEYEGYRYEKGTK